MHPVLILLICANLLQTQETQVKIRFNPTFNGVYGNRKVTSIPSGTTVYNAPTAISEIEFNAMNIAIYPNPASDLVAIQIGGLVKDDLMVELYDVLGKQVQTTRINQGQTIAYFDVQTLYSAPKKYKPKAL